FTFFLQAADGIRAFHVTGVQTCALPISPAARRPSPRAPVVPCRGGRGLSASAPCARTPDRWSAPRIRRPGGGRPGDGRGTAGDTPTTRPRHAGARAGHAGRHLTRRPVPTAPGGLRR